MRNRGKAGRILLRPRADFDERPIPATRQPARNWFRIHRHDVPPLAFGIQSFHRFSHPRCPDPLLYVGSTIQTCLWEIFGHDVFQGNRAIATSKWTNRCVSEIHVPELVVCALSLEKTRDAMGVDKASLLAADFSVPQAWGLAVQQHPAAFQAIKYTSRFLDQPCLALFGREGMQARLKATFLGTLGDLEAAVDWLHERKTALV